MFKINKSVELVTTTIKSLSSMSHESRIGAKAALERRYEHVRITDIRSVSDLDELVTRQPDLAFLGLKFIDDSSQSQPQQVWISEYLSEAGIAYTGSDKNASMLEHNKQLSKHVVAGRGLKTAASKLIKQGESYGKDDIDLKYPLFVKPVDGGGGSGINDRSLVKNFDELTAQVDWLFEKCNSDALIETYLPGREFSVGILKKRFSDDFHMLPLEIIAPINRAGSRFLSSSVKRSDSEQTIEVTDSVIRERINQLAFDSFEALGAEDYGRVDIRLDANGEPHFLEANLLPSLLDNYGNLPKAAKLNIGLDHNQLIHKISELGLTKKNQSQVSSYAPWHAGIISEYRTN